MEARLIFDESRKGALNMAIDEMLLSSCAGNQSAVLRFYTWSEPTLSLGYFQPASQRDSHSPSQSCSLVRRSSGGGAILHDHELTYSLCTARDSVRAQPLYDLVHDALVEVLEQHGVEAAKCQTPIEPDAEPFLCFQRRSVGDVIAKKYKIAGSAQRKHRGVILQHGSLLVKRSEFAPELPGLIDLCAVELTVNALKQAWAAAIGRCWGVKWQTDSITSKELAQAQTIKTGKFGCSYWSHKR